MLPSAPVLPVLDAVRVANPDDLPRLALVAAAGFFHSPTFHYQRLHHAEYPDDTILSYWSEYQGAMKDPQSLVLVAEDLVDDDEAEGEYPALKTASVYRPVAAPAGSKIVVGVASLQLKPGSVYKATFQPVFSMADGSLPANLNRDLCRERVRVYNEATAPAKTRHLQGQMRLSTLAVHPAYWRRGHATRLVSWVTRLADLDRVPVGISAVPRGAAIAARAGFEHREVVRVRRACVRSETSSAEGPKATEVELWVAIRRPCGTPVSGESATSLESQA